MCSTKHKWVTLGSGTHNLIQHSTHDTNHVHRVQSLPFTLLPMVDPLSVSSTCCPSLETGSLMWMWMVWHAFTMQLQAVASHWWGTSWTSVDLTSAWEMMWSLLKHNSITHLHDHTRTRTHACTHTHLYVQLAEGQFHWVTNDKIYLFTLFIIIIYYYTLDSACLCMSVLAYCIIYYLTILFFAVPWKKQRKTYIHTCIAGQHYQCGSRNLFW